MRFRLRTLLILLAVGPPFVALGWWKYSAWRQAQDQREAIRLHVAIEGAMPAPDVLRAGK